jgi:hypothetical protein
MNCVRWSHSLFVPSFRNVLAHDIVNTGGCVFVCALCPYAKQDWGTEGDNGVLGANVASGYLHLLPAHCCESIGK